MSATKASTTSMTTSDLEQQVVVFSLGGENYGLPITKVREIIRYQTPGATGAASGLVQGMICLRGHVLPVVDLSSRLGTYLETNSSTKILVVEIGDRAIGLIVDAVEEVLLLDTEQIEPIPTSDTSLGDSIAKVGDRLITLIDADRALEGAV